MMKLSPGFLAKYLKLMSTLAIISAVLDLIMWITIRFQVPAWAVGIAWLGAGLMFWAVGKLIEEVKA